MKKLIVAKNIGFCEGVKRSLAMSNSALKNSKGRVFTDGPIVHNADVVNMLAKLGIKEISENIDLCKEDTVILRAHGVTKTRKEHWISQGCIVLDATCPKILRIIGLVKKYSNQGYFIILIGEHGHPETVGICSYAKDDRIMVVSNEKDFLSWQRTDGPILVLAQTTCGLDFFLKISEKIKATFSDVHVINTICYATQKRQQEIESLVESGCDSILVLGSEFSKNTNELAQIAINKGCAVQIARGVKYLDANFINNSEVLGLTSGASTDIITVTEVKEYLIQLLISE